MTDLVTAVLAHEAIVVRPGDTLVVRCQPGVSAAEAEAAKSAMQDQLPGVNVVIVAVDQVLVYRPDEVTP